MVHFVWAELASSTIVDDSLSSAADVAGNLRQCCLRGNDMQMKKSIFDFF